MLRKVNHLGEPMKSTELTNGRSGSGIIRIWKDTPWPTLVDANARESWSLDADVQL